MIFCAVDEYVLQVLIITNVCMIWGLILRNELLMCWIFVMWYIRNKYDHSYEQSLM